jgi:hypothetical protein
LVQRFNWSLEIGEGNINNVVNINQGITLQVEDDLIELS